MILQRDLILRSFVHHFMKDEVLLPQVRKADLVLLPFLLPEIHCKGLIFSVEVTLSVTHFEDLIDRFFFDDLLLASPILSHFDSLLRILQTFVESYALLQVCLLEHLNPSLFAFHHPEQFTQVDVLKYLELAGLLLQLVQSLRLVTLVLDQFLLLPRLRLHVVLQPLDDLLLRRNFLLRTLQLLLEYLLTLLRLS